MNSEYVRRVHGVLGRHGLSVAAYNVLSAAIEAPMAAPAVIEVATSESHGDVCGEQTAAQHWDALRLCAAAGLLHFVTEAERIEDAARWMATEYELCSLAPYFVGCVAPTKKGAALLARVEEDLHELRGTRRFDGVVGVQERAAERRLLGAREADVLRLRDHVVSDPAPYLGAGVQILHVGELEEIGEWWVNRFESLPSGYCVRITCKEDE